MASFVSPYKESRGAIREMVRNNIIVYVKADVETCKRRDFKGAYAKALSGEFKNFPGVDEVYEEPTRAEIVIDTDTMGVNEAVAVIVKYVKKNYVK